MSDQEAVWYYSQHGERKGPVTLEVLKGAITHMKVDREKDLVWGPGLPNWVKVAEVPELQGLASSPPPVEVAEKSAVMPSVEKKAEADAVQKKSVANPSVKQAVTSNPYKSPSAVDDEDSELADAMAARRGGDNSYGMGRLKYFFYPVLVGFILGCVGAGVAGVVAKDSQELAAIIQLSALALAGVISIFFTLSRLKNLRMSGWNIFWGIVPVMNFWLGFRLYACPAGYQDHKKLDTAGKVMTGFYIVSALISLVMLVSVLTIGADYYKKAAEEAQRKVDIQQSEKNEVLAL